MSIIVWLRQILLFIIVTNFVAVPGVFAREAFDGTIEQIEDRYNSLYLPNPPFFMASKGDKRIHILGTLHGVVQLSHFPFSVQQAFEDSEVFAMELQVIDSKENAELYLASPLEFNLREMKQLKADIRKGVESGFETEAYYDEIYSFSDDEMRTMIGLGFPKRSVGLLPGDMEFNYYLVWPRFSIGEPIIDMELLARALTESKNVVYLEDRASREMAYEQQRIAEASDIDSESETEAEPQVFHLRDLLRSEYLQQLVLKTRLHLAGQLRIYSDFSEQMQPDGGLSVALRNKAWIPKLTEMIDSGHRAFVAMGFNHLLGEQGVLALLRAQGYTVTRIKPLDSTTPTPSSQ